jgi:hypothetical protein
MSFPYPEEEFKRMQRIAGIQSQADLKKTIKKEIKYFLEGTTPTQEEISSNSSSFYRFKQRMYNI